jgi:hypothetical protein
MPCEYCFLVYSHFGHHVVELINATADGRTTHEAVRNMRTMVQSVCQALRTGAATVAGEPTVLIASGVLSSKCATASPLASIRGVAEMPR